MDSSDFDLLARWRKRRDATAFTEIVHRHQRMVYTTCRRVLGNESEAEDIAQDCFVHLSQTHARISESLGGWLYALAWRRSVNRLRAEGRRTRRERASEVWEQLTNQAHQDELAHHVDACIDSLSHDLRFVVVEYFLNGVSQPTIARGLGVSQSTISRRIEEGVAAIRDSLASRGIVITSTVLVAFFTAENAVAIPPALVAGLGKMALGGGAKASLSGAIGGILVMKKLAVGIAVALVLVVWYAQRTPGKSSEPIEPSAGMEETSSAAAESPAESNSETDAENVSPGRKGSASVTSQLQPNVDTITPALSRGVLEVGQGDSSIGGSVLWKLSEEPCGSCEVNLTGRPSQGTRADFGSRRTGPHSISDLACPEARRTWARTRARSSSI